MGLRSLGYNNQKISAIVQHVVGRNTLLGAPGVNHETLRKRMKVELFAELMKQGDPRIHGKGHVFDAYPHSKKPGFYEKFMAIQQDNAKDQPKK